MDLELNFLPNSLTQVVKDDGDVAENGILLVAHLMNNTSVFPGVVAVIPHLFIPWFEAFQANVTLPHPTKLSLLFQC